MTLSLIFCPIVHSVTLRKSSHPEMRSTCGSRYMRIWYMIGLPTIAAGRLLCMWLDSALALHSIEQTLIQKIKKIMKIKKNLENPRHPEVPLDLLLWSYCGRDRRSKCEYL